MKPGRRSGVADRIADVLLLVGGRLAMRASSAASAIKGVFSPKPLVGSENWLVAHCLR